MSTLPFLLSVADELDNLNSQSYMDDFGLGFHPHRQYYRTPTIQLSLPASTDWMENERSQRYRSHRFVYGMQNNLTSPAEGDEAANDYEETGNGDAGNGAGTSTDANRLKYTSLLNSNNDDVGLDVAGVADRRDDADTMDNKMQLYNLSKKCCRNYYRRCDEPPTAKLAAKEKPAEGGYRLHAKCMEGANSSSDESLQKPTSSIEFLTCFLIKKSRTPKGAGISGGSGKKSS